MSPVTTGHVCTNFSASTMITKKWQENVLNCRKCKTCLVLCLTEYMLTHIHLHLSPDQKFYAAGGFEGEITDTAWFVEGGVPTRQPVFLTTQRKQTPEYGSMRDKQSTIKFLFSLLIRTFISSDYH